MSCFRPLQQAYGQAVDEETRAAVAIVKQDFSRILPRARKEAFTRTNIVAGFERTGIYPYNPNHFEFLHRYHEGQVEKARIGTHCLSPTSSLTSLSDEDDPSTPQRRERTNQILKYSHSLLCPPPLTPTAALKALRTITNEAECLRARVGIQNGCIRELQKTEAG
ncbi:hypothetical protein DFJ43DRAFT_1074446 [Lentinula guzmanii]|uniref:Uncharacterized protein n=1 Tax=Lentinula guzmanii TaxID=2804957 RepID=A0AA38MTT6_9AGAR|nr:hypothetical protein DFJ43DRAFT_1074446 [Lentinula guzmanii]